MAQQQPQYRHQNDVEPGDETGLGGGGIEQPHLLQGGGTEQHQPGQHTTDQQLAMVARDGNRLSGFEPPEQRQQGEGAEQKAQAIESIGPHVIHPEALGDKAHTPDGGSHQQHQIGAHGDSSLNRRVTGYPIQDTRLPILLSPLFVFALALHALHRTAFEHSECYSSEGLVNTANRAISSRLPRRIHTTRKCCWMEIIGALPRRRARRQR